MASAPGGDPVLAACKDKLKHFRLKELKDVLCKIGLSKHGKKQELVDKIVAILSDQQDQASKIDGLPNRLMVGKETVVKIVEDTFRKMREPANAVSASGNQNELGYSVMPMKNPDDSAQLDIKVRCPCGSSMATGSMIQCDHPRCSVWQHIDCVIIPEKTADTAPQELPSSFYCEMCRVSRADPFWVTINHPLFPVSIAPSNIMADGSYTVQYIEKTFPLSRANREMLQKAEYDIQVWCILLDDKVPFRMHWPLHSDMQINGIPVRVVSRQATQPLGANGRDDGLMLTQFLKEGPNKIVLSRSDSRAFCLGVRIAKRRSLEEVLNLVPKEQDGEKFDDALSRVRRCVGGGTEADNADSDSDIEVVADSVSVNLRCPMTGSRIKVAGRFKPCVHMGCFDLEAFVELNQRSRKWQCPICLKNYSLENLIIDPYFNRITSLIKSCGDDISEIDVKPDGSWRAKGGAELKDLMQWHLPDGTLCMSTGTGPKPNMGVVKQEIKEEPLPENKGSRLKLGIRRNNNGKWEISKKGDVNLKPTSYNDQSRDFENGKCVTHTSNTNHEDAKGGSYNSEPGQSDHPTSSVYDLNSSPGDEHVPIVLSDSDDENATVLSPSTVNCGAANDTGYEFPPPNPLDTSGGPDETSFFLNENFDDLGLSFWEYPSTTQDDPGIQGTDNLGEVQNYPATNLSLHEPVSTVNLGVLAPAANQPEYGNDGSLNNAKNTSQKRKNPANEITSLDASVLMSGNDDDDFAGDRSGGTSSLSGQPRSVRPKSVLAIESDSD
ncbi:E3 SUMO-protein ligase SIZ2-like isoform X1 [Triticum urartu]|uniref:E3 SUMO-protein ligase SIZ1 n=3 Tax=Triticum urartu TaxID=4572 RepID=A0A8R7Q4D1_TRIUA|nr:E3 SUMO-protein ligase SIZ2-like isoform X1 [Triticum urartu]